MLRIAPAFPATMGEPMQIKATSQPKFRPGKVLKDAVQ
jgi:nucleoid DNA-binding protein